jgi:hypothetical protein
VRSTHAEFFLHLEIRAFGLIVTLLCEGQHSVYNGKQRHKTKGKYQHYRPTFAIFVMEPLSRRATAFISSFPHTTLAWPAGSSVGAGVGSAFGLECGIMGMMRCSWKW